jgi:hypothetical protein
MGEWDERNYLEVLVEQLCRRKEKDLPITWRGDLNVCFEFSQPVRRRQRCCMAAARRRAVLLIVQRYGINFPR